VILVLGHPPVRLAPNDAFLYWAIAPCRRERIVEVWPYTYRLSGSVIVFFDASKTVECIVRTEDFGDDLPAIVWGGEEPPNDALQLTKPAQAMELRS